MEYKAIFLRTESEYDKEFGLESVVQLNDYFRDGWEFTESISQSLSTGSGGTRYAKVIVILRKPDISL